MKKPLQLKGKKKLVRTVDATPSWVSLVPLFEDWIRNGNQQQYEEAKRNFLQMAKLSDAYRANEKAIQMHEELVEALADTIQYIPAHDSDPSFRKLKNKYQRLLKQAEAK